MKSNLTAGLEPQQKEEVVASFKASGLIRERLTTILEKKIQSSKTNKVSVETYSNPSWAYLQADANGYERAIKEVISLLSE